MREDIVKSIIKRYEETNPAPYDKAEEESAMAYNMYNMFHREANLGSIDKKYITYSPNIRVTVQGERHVFAYSPNCKNVWGGYGDEAIRMPSTKDEYHINELNLRSVFWLDWQKKLASIEEYNEVRNKFKQEIVAVIDSVNTTKQLVEIWPEVQVYIPTHLNDPSRIQLPAIRMDSINAKIGL